MTTLTIVVSRKVFGVVPQNVSSRHVVQHSHADCEFLDTGPDPRMACYPDKSIQAVPINPHMDCRLAKLGMDRCKTSY